MILSSSQRRAIMRQCAAGISESEIAEAFGISVAQVQSIDRRETEKALARRREAEPYQAPKPISWKTARPAEERLRTGDTCRAPDCSGRIERGSYCSGHAALFYQSRAA